LLALRLVRYARQAQDAQAGSELVEDLFARYFLRGENIGDPQTLRRALLECGIAMPQDEADAPLHHELPWLPRLRDPQEPGTRGITGVPHFVFNAEHALSGAVPAQVLLQEMRRALSTATRTSGP